MEMNKAEARYLVETRSNVYIEKHGSISKAIEVLELENNTYHDLWGKYSSDCLGHAIECTRLMIGWLKRLK